MIRQIRAYTIFFTYKVKESAQYKLNYISTLLHVVVSTIIYAIVSFALFSSGEQVDPEYLLCYYGIIALVADAMVPAQFIAYRIMNDITTGSIAIHLIRPQNYLCTLYAGCLGESLPKLILNVLFVTCAQKYFRGDISTVTLGIGLLSCICGLTLLFLLQAIIGCMAIWLKDITRIRDVIFNLLLLLGGRLIPVEYLFHNLKEIVTYTPIAYVYDIPLRIFLGKVHVSAFLMQIMWIAILGTICGVFFNVYVKKNIEMGG